MKVEVRPFHERPQDEDYVEAEELSLLNWTEAGLDEPRLAAAALEPQEAGYALSFILRPRSDPARSYIPRAPSDSFLRDGYPPTPTNPRGYHWGVDCAAPTRTIIQLPSNGKLRAKGYDNRAGYWMEWVFTSGPWGNRYGRFFHMDGPCGLRVGTYRTRRYAVGRVGCTGNCRGSHVHFELGRYPFHHSRDPRWNPRLALARAVWAKDY